VRSSFLLLLFCARLMFEKQISIIFLLISSPFAKRNKKVESERLQFFFSTVGAVKNKFES
jgi:hypothetical protein